MNPPFMVWRPGTFEDGICVLGDTDNFDSAYEIDEGVSRLANWPDDACAIMSKSFPKDKGLADSLVGLTHVVVSARVRAFLDSAEIKNVEFLPIKIINHKKRAEKAEYYLLNPLEIVDCIDMAASQARQDTLDPGMIDGVKQLVLRLDQIPPTATIFRAMYWPSAILVRTELSKKMIGDGLTNLRFVDPAKYKGLS